MFSTVLMTALVRSQISTGLCSTQPGRGSTWVCSSWCRATSAPEWSKTMNRVLVVPWSTAPTKSATLYLPRFCAIPTSAGKRLFTGVSWFASRLTMYIP